MNILFCNIGWMEKYHGITAADHIHGGGSYVKEQGMGHEVCNFYPGDDDYVYGYVQPTNNRSINLQKINSSAKDLYLSDVLVIWTATRPAKLGGGTTIVGWYRHATVFREFQTFSSVPTIQKRNGISRFLIKTLNKDAILLPIDARTFDLPRGVKGSIGQSNVWYADTDESKPYVEQALSFIHNYETPISVSKRSSKQNQERKVLVEKAAIQTCSAYFEKLGYTVKSVEKDNLGWDLIATKKNLSLNIEVKGLSGSEFLVELTPNEYRAFEEKQENYRLAVVTHALEEYPHLAICRFSVEKAAWLVETDGQNDRSLDIKIKQSATISCAQAI